MEPTTSFYLDRLFQMKEGLSSRSVFRRLLFLCSVCCKIINLFSFDCQKYILGYLARVVFYKTGQAKVNEDGITNTKLQLDPRDSRGTEEVEMKARIRANKWRKRKMRKIDVPMLAINELAVVI